jgi:hypothetical protein
MDRGVGSASLALALGAVSFVSPPLALLGLAALAARLLFAGEAVRIDWMQFAGPFAAAFAVGAFVGLSGAIGVLFAWRLLADARWSVGEAMQLATAAGRPAETTLRSLAHAWLTPLFGLTLVAYTAPHTIAGLPLDLPHVPVWLVIGVGVLATCALLDWALQRAADWRLGELAAAPAAHLLTHHVVFLIAFGIGIDVSAGVVALAAWRLLHATPARATSYPSFTAVP